MIINWLEPEILQITPPDDWKGAETLDNVIVNIKMIKSFTGDKRYGIVAGLPDFTQTEEARNYYRENMDLAVCLAMVGNSFVKKIVGNFLIGTLKPKTNKPIKVFSNQEDALIWVRSIMAAELVDK